MLLEFKVNGVDKQVLIEEDEILLDTLRKIGCLSVKRGCDTSACSLCSVIFENKAVLACSVLSARAHGREVFTLEGLRDEAHLFAKHLADEGGDQCGYCTSGLTLSVISMKKELGAKASDKDIIHYLNGSLCRCTGYQSHLRAIKKYLMEG